MTFEIPNIKQIPAGTYKAQLEKVEVVEGGKYTSASNPDGSFRKWHWLLELDGKLEAFSDTTSINTGPNSTSYKRLTALLGEEPKSGQKIETPTGKTVLLQITQKENGFPKVEAVLPYVDPQQTTPGVPR